LDVFVFGLKFPFFKEGVPSPLVNQWKRGLCFRNHGISQTCDKREERERIDKTLNYYNCDISQ
jgi:hypothetical protein